MITKIKKRNGEVVDFDSKKIENAIKKAIEAIGEKQYDDSILTKVISVIDVPDTDTPAPLSIEVIQDTVENALIEKGYIKEAKQFILYRENQRRLRDEIEIKNESIKMIDSYLDNSDWEVNENANTTFSLQGLNHFVTSKVSKRYWLNKIYNKEIRDCVKRGDFHIHDLGINISPYCSGWSLYDLLQKGFTGVPGKISSSPAKHFRTALGQVVNFMFSVSGEIAGATAFSNFDTLLAPFIYYDKLDYSQVKQALQEFLFNMNVATRTGFQCVDSSTEVLTKEGWKKYTEIKKGDLIFTFNTEKQKLEVLPLLNVFKKEHDGEIYNIKSEDTNQFLSPNHRVVVFENKKYIIKKVEDVKIGNFVPVLIKNKIGISEIKEINKENYKGIIWCPTTKNGTFVARRNGFEFITGNCPFSNVTLDLTPSENFAKQPVMVGGKLQDKTYSEFQEEMNIFNKALFEAMMAGDSSGRVFTFPIPTINVTPELDWDNPSLVPMWEANAKYGICYFANYINSDMKPSDAVSMCCRLRLNLKELKNRGGGGLFGSGALTGSINVTTINMPRIGYLSKTKEEYFDRLGKLMDLAKTISETKRKIIEKMADKSLYPYSKFYLANTKKQKGAYYANHFSTIGMLGMNESLLNFIGKDIGTKEGIDFTLEVLTFMRDKLISFQEETGSLFNLEQSPCESTSFRLALKDKEEFPNIITAGTEETPYYTNSTQLPVNYTDDVFEAMTVQDKITTLFTGGSVIHIYVGERLSDIESVKALIKKIFTKFKMPYISLTPSFSICSEHGYLDGEQPICPQCNKETEIFSRVCGYLRPVKQFNRGKKTEFKERIKYKL